MIDTSPMPSTREIQKHALAIFLIIFILRKCSVLSCRRAAMTDKTQLNLAAEPVPACTLLFGNCIRRVEEREPISGDSRRVRIRAQINIDLADHVRDTPTATPSGPEGAPFLGQPAIFEGQWGSVHSWCDAAGDFA